MVDLPTNSASAIVTMAGEIPITNHHGSNSRAAAIENTMLAACAATKTPIDRRTAKNPNATMFVAAANVSSITKGRRASHGPTDQPTHAPKVHHAVDAVASTTTTTSSKRRGTATGDSSERTAKPCALTARVLNEGAAR